MKKKITYKCNQCDFRQATWAGKCPNCNAWNSFEEIEVTSSQKKNHRVSHSNIDIVMLKDIDTHADFRIFTNIGELDRVLGGGIIPGSLILVGGDPGIGKSTLMLQMASAIRSFPTLYVSGEESLKQIKYRSQRLNDMDENLQLLAETNIEKIVEAIKQTDCTVVIVDSIQSAYSELIDATPGSMSQVRECASLLMQVAKNSGKAIFIIGHVTKDGAIAGPKVLEHLVDTVLQFEGEKNYSYRLLRALKNRFGSTNEIGIFEMRQTGLAEVTNPSEIFLVSRRDLTPGIGVVAAVEGTRPILLEVQSLVSPTGYNQPQRSANGFDNRRLQMILAILEKRIGEQFRYNDVFVNITGGVYINDTSIDLGIAAALVSSLQEKCIPADTVLIGEIGLTGEVRSVPMLEQRVSEARKLGFKRIICPKSKSLEHINNNDSIITPVEMLREAFDIIFA